MDLFYLIGYGLGIAISIAILALPIVVIVLIVKKVCKSRNTSQSNIYNSRAVQGYQSESVCSTQSSRAEVKEQRRIQKEQQKIEAANAKAERLAKKRAEKEAAQLEKQRKKNQENALTIRAAELSREFPLIRDFHFTEIEFVCKTKKQYESANPEVLLFNILERTLKRWSSIPE